MFLLAAVVCAACGGATKPNPHTVTFNGGGSFPPSTIVGRYSVRGCTADAKTLVGDAHAFYAHSTYLPGPADPYYDDMRLDLAHFEADACTSKELGEAMARGLNKRQQAFVLDNVASDLSHAFRSALDTR